MAALKDLTFKDHLSLSALENEIRFMVFLLSPPQTHRIHEKNGIFTIHVHEKYIKINHSCQVNLPFVPWDAMGKVN